MRSPPVHLEVTGQADGPTSEFLKYVESTPVQRMIGGFTERHRRSGRGKLRLKLDLPLADLKASKVAGEYEFSGNDVIVHASLPEIERASGRLRSRSRALRCTNVKGRLFGGAPDSQRPARGAAAAWRSSRRATLRTGAARGARHPLARYLSGSASYTDHGQRCRGAHAPALRVLAARRRERAARAAHEERLRGAAVARRAAASRRRRAASHLHDARPPGEPRSSCGAARASRGGAARGHLAFADGQPAAAPARAPGS